MTEEELKKLLAFFNEEKTYYVDGYYRIRILDENKIELAYLIPDSCGTTTVHPQITVEKQDGEWLAVKLIDLGTSPTQFIERDTKTKSQLEQSLKDLLAKFKHVMK